MKIEDAKRAMNAKACDFVRTLSNSPLTDPHKLSATETAIFREEIKKLTEAWHTFAFECIAVFPYEVVEPFGMVVDQGGLFLINGQEYEPVERIKPEPIMIYYAGAGGGGGGPVPAEPFRAPPNCKKQMLLADPKQPVPRTCPVCELGKCPYHE